MGFSPWWRIPHVFNLVHEKPNAYEKNTPMQLSFAALLLCARNPRMKKNNTTLFDATTR